MILLSVSLLAQVILHILLNLSTLSHQCSWTEQTWRRIQLDPNPKLRKHHKCQVGGGGGNISTHLKIHLSRTSYSHDDNVLCPVSELCVPVPWGEIRGQVWGPDHGKRVLCLHGWSDNCGSFNTLIPLLPQGNPPQLTGSVCIFCHLLKKVNIFCHHCSPWVIDKKGDWG